MTVKADMLQYVKEELDRRGNREGDVPVYSLLLFTNPNKEKIYERNGKTIASGLPDMGTTDRPGFYFNLDDAIEAMHENACDIRENCFGAGFILCRFAGLYDCCPRYARMYFVWDEEKHGFFEQEEPEIFKNLAF